MRFLLDVQLPRRLMWKLVDLGHEAVHVTDLAPPTTPDPTIWELAVELRYAIITKDEDFVYLSQRHGGAVGVVWLRCGNIGNTNLLQLIERHLPAIVQTLTYGPRVIEVR